MMTMEIMEERKLDVLEGLDFNQYKKKSDLAKIIERQDVKTVLQPIISLIDGRIIGYEALSRIVGNYAIQNPDELFSIAVRENQIWELEQLCRSKALQKVFQESEETFEKLLFLNVSPKVVHDEKFREGFTKDYLSRYQINPSQIVFELTERDSTSDIDGFKSVVEHYKYQNYEIAIDDLGSCYSGLNLMCELQPHYVKIDMNLIRDIHKDRSRYALVKSLMEFSNLTNIKIIAEGIETTEEMETLIQMGIQYGQGYFIARPADNTVELREELLDFIKAANIKKHSSYNQDVNTFYIKHICTNGLTISESMVVEKVLQYFEEKTSIPGVCITDDLKVKGILTREKLQKILSGRYGFSLNQKKKVAEIMEREFLEVDEYTPISCVAAIAMERKDNNLYDFVVVTKAGKYFGIVTIKDLLLKATEINVNTARCSNPLSGLPGNLIINNEIAKILQKDQSYSMLYLDLDNFKAFNDVYGFEAGDEMIKILSQTLKQVIGEHGFVGHVGGDDFVVIFNHNQYMEYLEQIQRDFIYKAHQLYNQEDRSRGFIIAKNRHGDTEHFPLITLTIAVTTNLDRQYGSQFELSEELALRKKKQKQIKTHA